MAAHRYWRLKCIGIGSGGANAVPELNFRQTVGGASLTGTPLASNSYNAELGPDKAFDGLSSTYWVSLVANSWLGLDLGTPKDVVEYYIGAANGVAANEMPAGFTLDWSDDAATWTIADSQPTVVWSPPTGRTFTLVSTVVSGHNYWRLTGFLTDSNALELSQAQLYDGAQLIAQAPTFTVQPTTGVSFPDVLYWDDFSMPSFALTWNLATPVANPSLRLGAGSSADTFPKEFYCQYSDDGEFWGTNNAPTNVAFPGVGLMTAAPGVGGGGTPEMLPYRYFQFKVLSSDHASYASVAEINALNAGVEVPVIGKTYSSSPYWIGVSADAFNGTPNDYFSAQTTQFPWTITLDFGIATKVTDFGIRATDQYFSNTSTAFRDFDILGSNDDTAYDTLHSVRITTPWALGEKRNFALTAAGATSGATSAFIPLSDTPAEKRWRRAGPNVEVIAGADLPAFNLREVTLETSFMDAYHGGQGRIYGTVAEKGTPNKLLHREVLLIDEASNVVIRKTWSDPVTGVYEFAGIRQGVAYTVLSYDYTNSFRAVVADNLLPELMQ